MVGSPLSNDWSRFQMEQKWDIWYLRLGFPSFPEAAPLSLFSKGQSAPKSPEAVVEDKWTATSRLWRAIPVGPISKPSKWLTRQNALPPTTLGPPEPICLGGIHSLNLIGIGMDPCMVVAVQHLWISQYMYICIYVYMYICICVYYMYILYIMYVCMWNNQIRSNLWLGARGEHFEFGVWWSQPTTSTEAEETRAVYVPLAERFGVHIWKTEFEEIWLELTLKHIDLYYWDCI